MAVRNKNKEAIVVLTLNTLAFFVCFACWVIYGVLITFLTKQGIFHWSPSEIGVLIGVPILVGSITRLPVGILTDRYGGRIVFPALMLLSAVFVFSVSFMESMVGFILVGIGLGLSGASFAVGVASTAACFEKERQGTALGIFGTGNLGAAFTTLIAPSLLFFLTRHGAHPEGWRYLPQIYAAALVGMAILFYLTIPLKPLTLRTTEIHSPLRSLRNPRVWRFGLYYFCFFGGFVALAQWLTPYYVNAYGTSLKTAGFLSAFFSLPCAVIRVFGGWISDYWGARRVLYGVFGLSLIFSLFLSVPHLNLPFFTFLVFCLGTLMGIGMGAVFKHIPSYFPGEVGMVGGLVGVVGGLGGFFLPIAFGFFLQITGLWTASWMVLTLLFAISLVWMHRVIRHLEVSYA